MGYCAPRLTVADWQAIAPPVHYSRDEPHDGARKRFHRETWETGLPPGVRKKSPTARSYQVSCWYGSTRFHLTYVTDPKAGGRLRRDFYRYLYRGVKLSFVTARTLSRSERRSLVNRFLELIRWPTRVKGRAG